MGEQTSNFALGVFGGNRTLRLPPMQEVVGAVVPGYDVGLSAQLTPADFGDFRLELNYASAKATATQTSTSTISNELVSMEIRLTSESYFEMRSIDGVLLFNPDSPYFRTPVFGPLQFKIFGGLYIGNQLSKSDTGQKKYTFEEWQIGPALRLQAGWMLLNCLEFSLTGLANGAFTIAGEQRNISENLTAPMKHWKYQPQIGIHGGAAVYFQRR